MKFIDARPFSNPETAARKLMELANAFAPIQDGRIYIEKLNWPFLSELKGTPAEYRARLPEGWRVYSERAGGRGLDAKPGPFHLS
jgi:hypothetical protein